MPCPPTPLVSPARWLPALLFASVALNPSFAETRVAIKATADEDYVVDRLDENGTPRVQKYVFLEGAFSPGTTPDKSLDEAEFNEVVHTLAPYLTKKDFWPAKEIGDADLVIAVHWGTTVSIKQNTDYMLDLMSRAREEQMQAKERAESLYGLVENEGGDPRAQVDDGPASYMKAQARSAAAAPNYEWVALSAAHSEREIANRPSASILGFTDVLNRDSDRMFTAEDARTVRAMLEEERYFVILVAYDLKNRNSGEAPKRVWIARLSIRSPGTNFTEALEHLGQAGGDYFGENHPGLRIEKVPEKKRKAEVDVGDPIVVEDQPAPPR